MQQIYQESMCNEGRGIDTDSIRFDSFLSLNRDFCTEKERVVKDCTITVGGTDSETHAEIIPSSRDRNRDYEVHDGSTLRF
ncbi:hypothetical protein CEXT_297261 [Caerostris extrusa]|uniref:Uncharacterized protein n=1 Tax=Caerostris extrusa TaxID=172846 RepID=A0AAV4MEL0_CAEEX|nr:hypothetical protein CEXT_297261 [Caerostris extrusa]